MAKQLLFMLYLIFTAINNCSADPLPAKQQVKSSTILPQSAPEATNENNTFPIIFSDIEIFNVKSSPIASLSPEERASLIYRNIQNFADSSADISELKIIETQEGLGIGNEKLMLMIITNQDAELAKIDQKKLASTILLNIHGAVNSYRTKHSWLVYGLGATFSLLSILLLWQVLFWNNRAFNWLQKYIFTGKRYWERGIHIKKVEILSARRLDDLLKAVLNILRLLVVLLSLYFFLPVILSFFPETRELSSTIFEYLLTPFKTFFHAIIEYIPNLFYIFVIILIAYYVLKLISYFFNLIDRGELVLEWFYRDWATPTYQIIRFLIIITSLISAYPYIPGSSSSAFQGVGLVLGAIISFASSSAISNIVAGIILTYTRAFKLNDRIKVGETIGDVVEKTLLVTRIMTIKHVVVTIPNSLVMSSQIVNYSTSAEDQDGVILHTSITIGYDVHWQKVQTLLLAAAKSTKLVLTQPAPFVLQTALNDFYVQYEINVYTKFPENMAVIYSDLHKNILDQFNQAGVEIMSPHYQALRDGNATTVPSVLNTPGYAPPTFQINK